jgi:hypothetical protein
MGGPVRTQIVWVSAGSKLSGRDRGAVNTLSGKNAKRLWVLDADLTAAFDRIDHDHLLARLGSCPGRDLIRAWLKAGVFEKAKGFAPTEEGTPQGGGATRGRTVVSGCIEGGSAVSMV